MRKAIGYLWAAPWTLAGAGLAGLVWMTGGQVGFRNGLIEAAGGALLRRLFPHLGPGGIVAITMGHSVLAVDAGALATTRNHERVHVGQFERWGLLFPVAYCLASLAAAAGGGHYYRDNRFEREARARAG